MMNVRQNVCRGECTGCNELINYKPAGILGFGEDDSYEDYMEEEFFLCLDCHTTLIDLLTKSRDKLINDPPVRKKVDNVFDSEEDEDDDDDAD